MKQTKATKPDKRNTHKQNNTPPKAQKKIKERRKRHKHTKGNEQRTHIKQTQTTTQKHNTNKQNIPPENIQTRTDTHSNIEQLTFLLTRTNKQQTEQ